MDEKISIIIPALNSASTLKASLDSLQELRQRGHEVVVVDGGSRDNTAGIARKLADKVMMSGPGSALQMNVGADSSANPVLLFLHPDTVLPPNADELVQTALSSKDSVWGCFNIRFESARIIFRVLEKSINLKSAATGLATGSQAIFVTRRGFEKVGYYDGIPLLEDVALSKKLRKLSWPQQVKTPVVTSGEDWEKRGVMRTVMLRWRVRAAYTAGVHPDVLVQRYYPEADQNAD